MDNPAKENSSPNIMIGAVYFRKTNPPKKDWEKDYKTASEDGHNIFRHWFPWGAIEIAPGKYDWDDYDRQLDLAVKYNIKTIIAEHSFLYPEWLFHKYPHAVMETRTGAGRTSDMQISCATGGSFSLCIDNPEIMGACENFLQALAKRYKDHPGLYGYDVWNECSFYHPDLLCYCPATQEEFRKWLKEKYKDIKTLSTEWHRYSYTDWNEIKMSRQVEFYPDALDRIKFHNHNAIRWMKRKIAVIKKADPLHLITAHGNAKSFSDIAACCGDDFEAAQQVDSFGYTYWYGNNCSPVLAGDLIRSASAGKTFWRAEAVGDSDFCDRNIIGEPDTKKDLMHDPKNIRLDMMLSLACGAKGFLNPRWRPLLDGPLFGAFGWYAMDGSRTDRSVMVSEIAKWANDRELRSFWNARPVKGELAILLLEDSQACCYVRHNSTEFYSLSLQGAYQAFLDSNIQCDIIKIDQLDNYDIVYIPFPVSLQQSHIEKIKEWVKNGGCLFSEACFGYFNEYAHAFERQPSRGFDEVFGCTQKYVSFAPDRFEKIKIRLKKNILNASLYYQSFIPGTGKIIGRDETGEALIIENQYDKGTAVITGSMPGFAYYKYRNENSRKWFGSLLSIKGGKKSVKISKKNIFTRLWKDGPNHYLWILNMSNKDQNIRLEINTNIMTIKSIKPVRVEKNFSYNKNDIKIFVPGRDASILKLLTNYPVI